ncbi:hypothetical protein MQE23_16265 [Streptomyces sp. HP-A2021]|uniref:hypothetical protein n=1 Tax=Streptomyces sp. HP-A2021 TaxID=2927875 RepID=UPI001FB03EFB|nr:hypothetical protein [Streptomyces sp. HP-A2021]UOB10528.1 hypothetical protein MQE23_16265 [Streptomyces sp. HP-A2021]
MIHDVLLVGPPVSPRSLAEALAGAVRTEGADVDVADRDGDQSRRDWTAPVLCGYLRLRGDLSFVLYPAEEDLPSAYWLATSSGESVRARLYASDDEPPVYTIDAVESAVAQLPHIRVSDLPEIARKEGDR